MKVLFFQAVSGHPKVAPALMMQAANTLRPFNRYLAQAIHTAKQRQTRYALPWERVRDLKIVALRPMDTRFRLPRRQPGWILTGWPASREPDLVQKLMIVNRGLTIDVDAATFVERGVRIRPSAPLSSNDQVWWCGVQCGLEAESQSAPPATFARPDGSPLRVLRPCEPEGDDHWSVVLEGEVDAGHIDVDGERVEVEPASAFAELRRLIDAAGTMHEMTGGALKVEELPATGSMRGDNGIRFEWELQGGTGRAGLWIQLLPPDRVESDEFLDPRAAFCEDEVSEVWTQPRRPRDGVHRVKRVDRDRYQLLLDRLPPPGSTLYLPVDVRNLHLQRRALRQLAEAPLPHHAGLLRLCEDPARVRWPPVRPEVPSRWESLKDETRSGTDEQRAFVGKALGTPDLALLEGPPGSGKTTAICEIVQQLVERGKRVLLCASTHVAIDNVLERLLDSGSPIDAVRIGKVDRVDPKVQASQIDARVEALVTAWRSTAAMRSLGDGELREAAERAVVMAANLTCGTTMGIVNHPLFRGRDEDLHVSERPIATLPHWDVLVVDEASKTLIPEFLVPALMARRWIVVGDVAQLPPFTDRGDVVANLRALVDEKDREVFPPDHQRACLLLFRLARRPVRDSGARWLVVEPPGVLDWIRHELELASGFPLAVARVVARTARGSGPIAEVTVHQVVDGHPEALRLAAADWVLVGTDVLGEVARFLPSHLLPTRDLTAKEVGLAESDPFLFRHARWLARTPALRSTYRERGREIASFPDAEAHERKWLAEHDLAGEVAWRLTRIHDLRRSRDPRERDGLLGDLRRLLTPDDRVAEPIREIQDVGLPSILEVLQEGIGEERANRPSALTAGLPARQGDAFDARFGRLTWQHRMHPDISEFPRAQFYDGESLQDANTIAARDEELGWDFGPFRARRVWMDVRGTERAGENGDEVRTMEALVRTFIAWAEHRGTPRRSTPRVWELACLCFYVKQERAISAMLQRVTGDFDRKSRFERSGVEIVSGTVDRFQGREADLVLISMRNTRRVGFLDSPNRLNVAVTRARQQLVVVGHAQYFGSCGVAELQELVKRTPQEDARAWLRGRR